jgi:hypothetical protein
MRKRLSFSKEYGIGIAYHIADDGTSWKRLQIGGQPQEEYQCHCSYDCCGHTFCNWVNSYLGGFITIGSYAINV